MSFAGVHRVGHIGIWVTDIDKSLDWYRNVVGLKLTGLWGEPYRKDRQCFVRCEDWHHDIVFFEIDKTKDRKDLDQSDTGKRHLPGVHHIAFEIPEREDWLNALEECKKKDIPFVSGPYVHGHEAKYVEGGDTLGFIGGSGSHAFYITDPDGNRLEFYTWMMKVTKKCVAAPNPDF
jgi:catechol 2,3-dioxygenase-like lactoylglutathione lyase family enzyme